MARKIASRIKKAKHHNSVYVGRDISEILCIQETRVVNNDNTISYKGNILQIPEGKHQYNYAKSRVTVHEYENKQVDIFYGQRKLARFDITDEEDNNDEVNYEFLENKKIAA